MAIIIKPNVIGSSFLVIGNRLKVSTTTVADPILMKLITAAPCDLSFTLLIASVEAFEKIKETPK
jgi:hypothetical protein